MTASVFEPTVGRTVPAQGDAPGGARRSARRWLLLGSGGAGKSTLARELSEVLRIPVIHLDRSYWKPGWIEPSSEEFERTVSELVQREEWIMDGNYWRTLHLRLPRAEAAILLDPPTVQCLWGVLERSALRRWRTRPDLPEGCEESFPDLQFIRYVASYKRRSRPKVLGSLKDAPHVRFYHFSSRRQVRAWLADLSERHGAR